MHSEYALALCWEALWLLLFGLLGARVANWRPLFLPLTVGVLCYIMGLQNAIATKLSHAEIRTTHMTGIITDIGIELGKWIYWNRSEITGHRVLANRDKLKMHASMLGCFFAGAVLGAYGFSTTGFRTTLPIAALLLLLAVVPVLDDLRRQWRR